MPDKALSQIDNANIVSMAHAYGNSEFRMELNVSEVEEEARVTRENNHLLSQASRFPGRVVAFCSVPLRRPYAMREMERCIAAGGKGIKWHLAASEVDLREASHLRDLATLAASIERQQLPILLHLDTQIRGTDTADIANFLKMVLEPHPQLTVIIAHFGGSGGYGRWTQAVHHAVNHWLGQRTAVGDPRGNVFLDISAVVLEEASEGVPATSSEESLALAQHFELNGLAHVVFGSDAPVFSPQRYAAFLVERGVLTQAQLDTVLRRVATPSMVR